MDLGLKGRVALVVGGSKNIGAATAVAFAREGVRLALVARQEAPLRTLAERLAAETGAEVLALPADVGRQEAAGRVVAETTARFGRIDILVNNAGRSLVGEFLSVSEEAWAEGLQINLLAAIRCSRAVLPGMIANRWGRIINIGAVSGKQPSESQMVSNVAKAGLLNFTKTLAAEAAPHNILVNAVNPGRCLNDRWRARGDALARKEGISFEAALRRFAEAIPLGRFAAPEEVAPLIVFLASDLASYITGQSIFVDGGMLKSAF